MRSEPVVASLLEHQLKRAAISGDTEDALAYLQRFLELERSAKLANLEAAQSELIESNNVAVFKSLRRAPFIS